MKRELLPINLSLIKMRNNKYSLLDNMENKSTNTNFNLINSNQRFIKGEQIFNTIETKKNINSYFFIKPKQQNFDINNITSNKHIKIKFRNNNFFLPMIHKNNISIKPNKKNKQEIFDAPNTPKIKVQKKHELVINPVSLYLNTEANNFNPKKNIFHSYSNRNKASKLKDEFLERVKDYRKRLKEQMIKRNKFQYSHSNNSINIFQTPNNEYNKETKNDKDKEKNETKFNYNKNNNYIFNMNENVEKALNNFYSKLKSTRILKYKKENSYINYSNFNSEGNLSNSYNTKDIKQNNFSTINTNKII